MGPGVCRDSRQVLDSSRIAPSEPHSMACEHSSPYVGDLAIAICSEKASLAKAMPYACSMRGRLEAGMSSHCV